MYIASSNCTIFSRQLASIRPLLLVDDRELNYPNIRSENIIIWYFPNKNSEVSNIFNKIRN